MAFKMKGHTLPGIKQEKSSVKKMYHSPKKAAKPDYIDIDGDGNKTESMKEAASSMKMYGKSPKKGKDAYVSDAQRRAVHASKADGGKGAPKKNYKKGYYGA